MRDRGVGERRQAVLAALGAARGRAVSGEYLADRLGCSRASIHRHVEALRHRGMPILGAPDGYVLAADADLVLAAEVDARLAPPLDGPVLWATETGSTNDDASARARRGAREGLIVGADRQTAGKGRRGRRWISDPGDALLVSFLLRPETAPVDAATLPLVVALAVADACGPSAQVAWPNDVMVEGRKVAGVLIETSGDHERLAWAVAGVGINVRGAPRVAEARWTPGALPAPPPRRADLLVALAGSLGRRYARWRADGPAQTLADYAARDALCGREVTVATDRDEVAGTALGVDELGRLRLRRAVGELAVSVGEVIGVRSRGE